MGQIADLNARLVTRGEVVTAAELGLDGTIATRQHDDPLPSSAVVVRLSWDGSPEFPYIHGHFSTNGSREGTVVVDLHTAALRRLSRRLAAHHVWGVGSTTPQDEGQPLAVASRRAPTVSPAGGES